MLFQVLPSILLVGQTYKHSATRPPSHCAAVGITSRFAILVGHAISAFVSSMMKSFSFSNSLRVVKNSANGFELFGHRQTKMRGVFQNGYVLVGRVEAGHGSECTLSKLMTCKFQQEDNSLGPELLKIYRVKWLIARCDAHDTSHIVEHNEDFQHDYQPIERVTHTAVGYRRHPLHSQNVPDKSPNTEIREISSGVMLALSDMDGAFPSGLPVLFAVKLFCCSVYSPRALSISSNLRTRRRKSSPSEKVALRKISINSSANVGPIICPPIAIICTLSCSTH